MRKWGYLQIYFIKFITFLDTFPLIHLFIFYSAEITPVFCFLCFVLSSVVLRMPSCLIFSCLHSSRFISILLVTVWKSSICMVFLCYDFLFYFQFFWYLSILSARAWVDGFLMSYPLWLEICPYTYVFVEGVYMLAIHKAKTQDWIRGSSDLSFMVFILSYFG